ncbi:MAG: hypothetical protein ACKOWG_18625 [Planctomycetia bacterium]
MTDRTDRPESAADRILYCRCAYAQVVPAAVKDAVLAGLAEAGRGFEMVPDLCEMAARRDPHLAALARGDGPLKIAACWPRAVQGLFTLADAPLPQQGVQILNMRTDTAEAVLATLLAAPGATPADGGGS